MTIDKKVIMLWICAIVVSSLLTEDGANAEPEPVINNPALGTKHPMPCGHNGDKFVGGPANEYDRGCEKAGKCGGERRELKPFLFTGKRIKGRP
ncbi:hypothetical protein V6N13_088424 [Hibiscus sabdariffa]